MNIRIRPFKVEDSKIIHQLYPDNWDFNFNSYIKNYFGKKYFIAITLLVDGQAAGFGSIIIFREIGWLGNIVIAEKYRGKGLGTKITNKLLVIGKESGVKTFNLVATDMGESIYKNLGFEKEFLYEFYHPPEKQDFFKVSAHIIKDISWRLQIDV